MTQIKFCHIGFLSAFLYLFPYNIHAQNETYVPGELIIQTDGSPLSTILSYSLPTSRSQQKLDYSTESLSTDMGYHLIRIDTEKMSDQQVLEDLKANPHVIAVQRNHYLQARRKPNDPRFDNQWPLRRNTSLNSDIDSEAAWDITTGGRIGSLHDIVIAVVDDGFQIDHPDLFENIYINTGEIPGNGIDDDGNGYIDDHRGWNFETNNDSLNTGNHGEPVAGVIGARGNNGIGIAGINWEVKILPLLLDKKFTDAGLLASYIYAYKLRKKFNETNGAEGAFVAVTNSSWGAEGYFPDEFPVWCNFYDSLSTVGILNCVATSNNKINIDEKGDIPSLCPSESVIVVTNTNMNRELVGAYGPMNVDLAAPGENIYTLKDEGYGYESGTSFSAPVASGVLGLMYSVPARGILEAALADPEQTALLFKNILLGSFDVSEELSGKIKVPGIINARKAVEGVLAHFTIDEIEYCVIDSLEDNPYYLDTLQLGNEVIPSGSNSGYRPLASLVDSMEQGRFIATSIISNVENDSLDFVIWMDRNRDSLFTENEMLVNERATGRWDGNFFMPENVDSGYYNLRVAVLAPTDSINPCGVNIPAYEYEDYSVYVKLNPLLCQNPPQVDTIMTGPDYLQILWEHVDSSVAYVFRYRQQGANEWEDEMVDTAKMFTLEDLESCTPYEFQVRSVCFYDTSAYTPIAVFFTACETASENEAFSQQIELYPNPGSGDHLTIRFSNVWEGLSASNVKISLYSMEGRLLRQKLYDRLPSESVQLSWPGLTQGLYLIRIDIADRFAVKKWVVR